MPFLIWSPVRDEAGRIVDFRFVYVNTAAAKVMRVQPGDYVGKRVLDALPRAWDEPGRLEMYVEALERNEVLQTERQSEADGNHAWYHIVASPLDGDLAVWFADITQRKAQERELLEADRRKDEFLATLAHELRNPLAPIRQAASIARNENATEAQRRWSNNVIERQVQHMSLLLDDLLDVSRITHGTLQLRKQHDRPAVRRRRRGRDRAAADRRAPPPAQHRGARASAGDTAIRCASRRCCRTC